jgi:DNA-binding transcriptional MerR regulator
MMSSSATRTTTTSDPSEPNSELRPIGAVADEVGLTPRTIRYYEELGLLRPAVRVKGASRLFDASDVARLREIKRLREVIGFSLAEVAALLDAEEVRRQLRGRYVGTTDPHERARVVQEAIELAAHRLALVDRRVAQIMNVRSEECARLERLQETLAALEAEISHGGDAPSDP